MGRFKNIMEQIARKVHCEPTTTKIAALPEELSSFLSFHEACSKQKHSLVKPECITIMMRFMETIDFGITLKTYTCSNNFESANTNQTNKYVSKELKTQIVVKEKQKEVGSLKNLEETKRVDQQCNEEETMRKGRNAKKKRNKGKRKGKSSSLAPDSEIDSGKEKVKVKAELRKRISELELHEENHNLALSVRGV